MTDLPFRTDAVLESLNDGFQAFDRDWRYVYVNRRAEQILQRPREELLGKVFWEEYPETIGTDIHARYLQAMETGKPVVFEVFSPDEKTWAEYSLHPYPGGIGAFTRDTTERKRSETALQGAGKRTAEILESMADAFYAVDYEWRFTYVNHRAEVIWGIPRERLLGQNLWEAFPASVGGKLEQELRRVAEFRHSAQFDLFSAVMGRWLVVGINPTATGLSVYFRDITERKQAEEVQWGFLRDVLVSVTDGKLRLCRTTSELPERLPGKENTILLTRESLRLARRAATEAGSVIGLDRDRSQDLLTAVGEATMNAVVHAGGGMASTGMDAASGRVQVWVEDKGAGIQIARLPQATLGIGYSTAGTLGHGVKLILQTIDRMWLLTGTTGTTVVLEQDRVKSVPGWLHWSADR